jgi:hypothetical protein
MKIVSKAICCCVQALLQKQMCLLLRQVDIVRACGGPASLINLKGLLAPLYDLRGMKVEGLTCS